MKKLLSTLSVLGLSVSTSSTLIQNTNTNIVDDNTKSYNLELLTNNIDNEKKIDIEVMHRDKFQRNIITRYPSKVGKPSDFNKNENKDMFKEISASNRNHWYGQNGEMVASFDIEKLGYDSKDEFLKDYREVEISYNYGYNFTNNGNKGWQNGSAGVEMGTPESHSYRMNLSNYEMEYVVEDKEFQHTPSSRHRVKMTLTGNWASSYQYDIKFYSRASLDYNKGSTKGHAAYSAFKFKRVVII